MQSNTKKLAGNALVYGLFGLLQKGLGFFLLPVYASLLDTEELGIISTSTAVISFLVILFGLSLRGSTAYYYYKFKDQDIDYVKKFFGTNFSFILLFTVFGILLLLIGKSWILDVLFKNIPFKPYILLSLASVLLQPVYLFYQSILKAKHQAKKASLLDFLFFGTMASITIILIVVFNFKAEGALFANSIASFLVFIVSLIGIRKEITLCFDITILKTSLKYSLPILPHNLSGWAMNMVDKLMLNNLNSLSVVALFDVGAQIGKVVNLISLGVNSAYSPWFFEQVKTQPEAKGTIVNITDKIILLYACVAVAASLLSPEVLVIIGKPSYYESWKVVPFIATAFVINGFYFTYSNVFFLEKTKYLPFLTVTGAITNLILNYFMIPIYGIFGAALASLITKIVFALLTYIICQRIYPIPYHRLHLTVIFGACFSLSCLPFLIQDYLQEFSLAHRILIKVLTLVLIFTPIIYKNASQIKAIIKK
ncbi:polysaccharide biosynthesis C-terminal domain-containing protein [Flagellimonas sp.]|uniref:lipopolysaccharide biosynthesis protein n=1 Tax=Flagellimonas sp. TaxID=2058762 RepID=UPI003BAAF210